MALSKKAQKYERLFDQIKELTEKCDNPLSRMATIVAILHRKMDYFYWTGYYLLHKNKLQVGPYQGTLACLDLKKDTGVCWAGINASETIIVPDVHLFEGHIACDSKSNSEIVVPLYNLSGKIEGILDIDSIQKNPFDETDALYLKKINGLVYG